MGTNSATMGTADSSSSGDATVTVTATATETATESGSATEATESSGVTDSTSSDGGSTGGSSSGGSSDGGTTGAVSASDSNSETGVDPNCEAPGDLISCDAGTDDPFQAMGLGCVGNANQVIPIANTVFSSPDAGAWRIATQLGSFIDPVSNAPLFSPREGDSFLVISSGLIVAPDGQGVITMDDFDTYNTNGNPDVNVLPAPMTTIDGSNNGAGGTPFVNCDGVNDCSDTIESQWGLGNSDPEDMLWFQFDTQVPGGTNGWAVDFAYFSVEFPEWVDTEFNDIFLVWSDSETYTGNLCFVNDQPCTVTALWPVAYQENSPELAGTGFQSGGGGTGWFTMQGSAAPGETLQLTTAIFDMGDSALDTLVLLDNWRWDCEGCVPSEVMGCGIEPTQ